MAGNPKEELITLFKPILVWIVSCLIVLEYTSKIFIIIKLKKNFIFKTS